MNIRDMSLEEIEAEIKLLEAYLNKAGPRGKSWSREWMDASKRHGLLKFNKRRITQVGGNQSLKFKQQ